MSAIIKKFEGHEVSTITYQGRACWLASQIGEALGYRRGGHSFVTQITSDWSSELIDGQDFMKLEGATMAEFRAAMDVASVDGESQPGGLSPRGRVAHLVLLFESGVHLCALKTRKPAGIRLRRWLADEVLPEIRRSGGYGMAGDSAEFSAVMAQLAQATAMNQELAATLTEIQAAHRAMVHSQLYSALGKVGAKDLTALAALVVDYRMGVTCRAERKTKPWRAHYSMFLRDAERHVTGVCGFSWQNMTVEQAGRMGQFLRQKLKEATPRKRRVLVGRKPRSTQLPLVN